MSTKRSIRGGSGTYLFLLSLLLFPMCFCCQVSAAAPLDLETSKPYDLQVVLHFSQHRLLTPVFQEQIKHELKDGLQAALGQLAQVEVTNKHPLLNDVLSQGLQRALDSWNALSDTKVHFVLIDFVDGRYDIQSRQYD